ncbi:MAG TPA: hypothetical protein VFM05_05620 [Candidatus Saccharimonadales bacterium]|nr:hypothetical protein [Candidatus Saccharimonadales bacterium]
MSGRFLAAPSVLALIVIVLFACALLINPGASASPQELTVKSQTQGYEVLKADFVDNQVRIRLQNNHKKTITAFAIRISGTATIREDFAYSEVHFGIEPGETFETSYPVSPSPEVPTIHLLAVLLKDGTDDGNSKVARQIKDQRLGQKLQILRTLRILEREGQSQKDLKTTKNDIFAALNTSESETLVSLSELSPISPSDNRLSDELKAGLEWGREKMLRKFDVLEKLPTENQEQAFTDLKDRARKLFSRL